MKRCVISCIVITFLILCASSSFALNGEEHDHYMYQVLFGSKFNHKSVSEASAEGKALKALSAASYLAIDEFNELNAGEDSKGRVALRYLKEYGVPDLPPNIDAIDYQDNNHHRRYTHRGWNGPLNNEAKPYQDDKAKWPIRKKILSNTVGKVFAFSVSEKKKCDSLSALIYYVHVIGDHIAETDYKKMYNDHIGLGGRNDQIDIIHQLQEHLEVIAGSGGRNKFYSLNAKLRSLNSKVHELIKGAGVDSYEKQLIHSGYAKELMELLIKSVPEILKEDIHFQKAFPSLCN